MRAEGGVRHRPGVSLADEPTIFVQTMLAGELHQRLADASHALAAEHRKLRKYKTILGRSSWRYVRPEDPESLRELGGALDGYLATDIAEAPAEIKAGAHLPFSLKYNLDGAALALRRTRRDASAKTLLSALIGDMSNRGTPQRWSSCSARTRRSRARSRCRCLEARLGGGAQAAMGDGSGRV